MAAVTVYVDEFPSGWGRWSGGGHMLGSDLGELHALAARIGLRRVWFQDRVFPHYDVVASKRRLARAAGAKAIEFGELPDDVLMRRPDGGYEPRAERLARRRDGGDSQAAEPEGRKLDARDDRASNQNAAA